MSVSFVLRLMEWVRGMVFLEFCCGAIAFCGIGGKAENDR
jgi:hypothetical protein